MEWARRESAMQQASPVLDPASKAVEAAAAGKRPHAESREIARLESEVKRLTHELAKKDELLLQADLRIRKLQEYVPKNRGGRKSRGRLENEIVVVDAQHVQLGGPDQSPPAQQPAEQRDKDADKVAVAVGSKRKNRSERPRAGWCHHNRQRSRCVDCGGSGICEHKRVARNCKDCGGNNLCIPHKRPKSRCVECGGASTCEHKKLRRNCFECGGVGVCVHKRLRRDCKDCKGRYESVTPKGQQLMMIKTDTIDRKSL